MRRQRWQQRAPLQGQRYADLSSAFLGPAKQPATIRGEGEGSAEGSSKARAGQERPLRLRVLASSPCSGRAGHSASAMPLRPLGSASISPWAKQKSIPFYQQLHTAAAFLQTTGNKRRAARTCACDCALKERVGDVLGDWLLVLLLVLRIGPCRSRGTASRVHGAGCG